MNETWTLPSHSNQFIKNCVSSLFSVNSHLSDVLCTLTHLQFIRQFPVLSRNETRHTWDRKQHEKRWTYDDEFQKNLSETIVHVVMRSGGGDERLTRSSFQFFPRSLVYIYILNINKLWMQSDDNKKFYSGVKKRLALFWLPARALLWTFSDAISDSAFRIDDHIHIRFRGQSRELANELAIGFLLISISFWRL